MNWWRHACITRSRQYKGTVAPDLVRGPSFFAARRCKIGPIHCIGLTLVGRRARFANSPPRPRTKSGATAAGINYLLSPLAACALAVFLAACSSTPNQPATALSQIDTIVVIYAENRSFDHLFGHFPGAEGIDSATAEQKTQLDRDGTPLRVLPPVYKDRKPHDDFPGDLPNGPFAADRAPGWRSISATDPDPTHSFYQHIAQINGGRNNMFVAHSNAGALPMATFDGSTLKMWQWAKAYTLADHFFQSAYGGSFINHQRLICACVPRQPDAPDSIRAVVDAHGRLAQSENSPASVMSGPPRYVRDGRVGPVSAGSYALNSNQPAYQPSEYLPPKGDFTRTDPARFPLTPLTAKTIGDTLSAKGISWAWYAQGWEAAQADGMRDPALKRVVINVTGDESSPNFQPHHQPFNYYARFAPGRADRATHLRDRKDLIAAARAGTLPQVSFYKPSGLHSQHSGSSTIAAGDAEIDEILTRLAASPQWPRMAIIVTYDEYGGYWDHMPPPSGPGWSDDFGPGTRIPAIIVSPLAKRGYVDRTVYDTTSIQKLLNVRFGLEPLPGLREKMGDLTGAFGF
ncbi:MAG: acid phosphatase [Betaproteobacteria bacterium]